MASFTAQTRINAPRDKVWEALSDIGGIYKWNPGVSHSHSTSESNGGDGATRHCDLQDGSGKKIGYLEERAFDWREGEGFKIDIYESNLPLKRNIVTFKVREDRDGTVVSVTPDYTLKFGPIGALADMLVGRRQFKKGMEGLLAGLKYHVETGELVEKDVPSGVR